MGWPMGETSEDSEKRRERRRPRGGHGSGLELIKVILDFLSKCFYPAIIVAVIVLLQPALSQIDLKALLARLQSAKAGGYEFTFHQAEDVGAATAPLNNKIADLKREVASLTGEVRALQKATGSPATGPAVPAAPSSEAAKVEDTFKRNSQYTVLVFNSSTSRRTAEKITEALLNAGYKSSRTETDFAELGQAHPAGTVYMTHDAAAESVYPEVARLIRPMLKKDADLTVRKDSIDLRRGDVQVLVF